MFARGAATGTAASIFEREVSIMIFYYILFDTLLKRGANLLALSICVRSRILPVKWSMARPRGARSWFMWLVTLIMYAV